MSNHISTIIETHVKKGNIYVHGDSKSYVANVRNRGYISEFEYDLARQASSRGCKPCDAPLAKEAEFPLDADGRYIVSE